MVEAKCPTLFVTGQTLGSDFFKTTGTFSSNIGHVRPAVRNVAKELERVRIILCDAFTAFENNLEHVTFANHTTRHAKIEEFLRKMSKIAHGVSIKSYSPSSPKYGPVEQRPRTQHNTHSTTGTVRRRVDSMHFAPDNLDNNQEEGSQGKKRKL
ncbi:hypothetical protein EIP86_001417 [Pleurotus ostreatoroseus]|nr:hypothetical protein EIP86_001417 [Pleurotus ostreatoroseus]